MIAIEPVPQLSLANRKCPILTKKEGGAFCANLGVAVALRRAVRGGGVNFNDKLQATDKCQPARRSKYRKRLCKLRVRTVPDDA